MLQTKLFARPSFTSVLVWSAALCVLPSTFYGCGEDAASGAGDQGVPSAMGGASSLATSPMPMMGAGLGGAMVGAGMQGAGAQGAGVGGSSAGMNAGLMTGGAGNASATGVGGALGTEPGMDGMLAMGGSAMSGELGAAEDLMPEGEPATDDMTMEDMVMDDMMDMDDMDPLDETMTGEEEVVEEEVPEEMVVDEGPVFHIFMLMGQSNMVGEATAQASDQNDDERLMVLGGCNRPPMQWNLANPPLHDCNPNPIGPGDWFGKTMLTKLPEGHTIGLVPTAVRGESINTFISGGRHHQSILDKIEFAKNSENARFSGIIFHQGETDTGQSWWVERVVQLYDEVKAAFGVDYEVPFIAGELPADPGNCCSSHNPLVNQLPDALPWGFVVPQDGTRRVDQYHFDHESVVLMGTRYGETMLEALEW